MSLKVISLFSGVGGLDFGFESAGYETLVALDIDPAACATMRNNRNWPVLEGPIAGISSRDILDAAGLSLGEADVLIGGPPCQPFSKSGYWARGDSRRLDDPRAATLAQYLRVLSETLPSAFLLENVPGLSYRGKTEGIEAIRSGIEKINSESGTSYSLVVRSLNAADYGVPQLRERVFVVGSRDSRVFRFPSPTHFAPDAPKAPKDAERYRTAWDAFADLPPVRFRDDLKVRGKWADLLPSVPEGQNYLWHTERGGGEPLFGWRRRYWNFLLKLAKEKPSWTIQAQPGPATGPFHWDNRRLSAEELCRLQTLPDGLRFNSPHSEVQKLVGNAVPSALAEVVAAEMAVQLFDRQDVGGSLKLAPTRQLATPARAAVRPVAKQFLQLVGTDTAHPGTGMGRSARSRSEEAA